MRINTAKDFSNFLLDGTHLQLKTVGVWRSSIQMVYHLFYTWFKWVCLNLAVTEMYQINTTRLFQLCPKGGAFVGSVSP